MRKILHLSLLLAALCLAPIGIHAQYSDARQIYYQAESEYEIGHFEQAIQLLRDNLNGFDGDLRQNVYRLLALCYMSEDQDEEAQYYAEQLVRLNNYYHSTDDPARFQDLISRIKESFTTTITTASSQSESVIEAPAPITIITAEMIDELGYNKNLAQILAAYVPGMIEVTSLDKDKNLSMHGAYASGQELILIMENGHRLNTRFDNCGSISYSISTEKIDHIEVLRGPTSSLYGNVALSAVVNIITKNGHTTDGVKAKYGYGSFNTHRADISMGTQFLDADIFAWASIYSSDGQRRGFGEGKAYQKKFHLVKEFNDLYQRMLFDPDRIYVDSYRDNPSYDVGMTFRLKGFELMFNKKNVKQILGQTTNNGGYDYDRYYWVNGSKPGYGTSSIHAQIGYTKKWRKMFLSASVYGDWYNISSYEVIVDSLVMISPVYDDDLKPKTDDAGNTIMMVNEDVGRFSYRHFSERTMGGILRGATDYRFARMRGNVLLGSQFESFSLFSTNYLWGYQFGRIDSGQLAFDDLIRLGKERSLSFFIQDKHYFLPNLIFNAGFRYDLKYRKDEKVVRKISPRLALMFVPHDRFSLKLSYSEAFADQSFYERYVIKGSDNSTDPQHLSAIQLTAMGTVPQLHLSFETNFFYNRYTNLLFLYSKELMSTRFMGRLTNIGIEATARYAYKRLSAYLSLYGCHDLSSDNYYYNESEKIVCGVPHFTLNIHGAWKVIQTRKHEAKLYGHVQHMGKKLNYSMLSNDFYVDAKWFFDLGAKYTYNKCLQLSLDCENVFDTDHYICGPNYQFVPMFQRGRSLMASLSYQF